MLSLPLQRAIQGVVEGGLGFLVVCLRNLALLAFDFELEQLFLDALKQRGRLWRLRA